MNRRALLLGTGGAVVAAGVGAFGWMQATGSMAGYEAYAAALRAKPPTPSSIDDLLRYASLAANGHNTQPWLFRVSGGTIDILPDPARRTPVVDPDDHHVFVSLGCAAENLVIAARATGHACEIDDAPAGDRAVRIVLAPGPAAPDPLFDAIALRQSTRAAYDGRPVPPADLDALRRAAAEPGVAAVFITERRDMNRVRDLVVAGNGTQMADPAFVRELKDWIRFNPRAAMEKGDGLLSAASGNPSTPTFVGSLAFDMTFSAPDENDKYARHIDSSAGLVVFVGERADPHHWIKVGRACQRFALAATSLGLKHAFINQPVEVTGLRAELAALAGAPGMRPDIAMRFGYGPQMPFSPRRPVSAVRVRA